MKSFVDILDSLYVLFIFVMEFVFVMESVKTYLHISKGV